MCSARLTAWESYSHSVQYWIVTVTGSNIARPLLRYSTRRGVAARHPASGSLPHSDPQLGRRAVEEGLDRWELVDGGVLDDQVALGAEGLDPAHKSIVIQDALARRALVDVGDQPLLDDHVLGVGVENAVAEDVAHVV